MGGKRKNLPPSGEAQEGGNDERDKTKTRSVKIKNLSEVPAKVNRTTTTRLEYRRAYYACKLVF